MIVPASLRAYQSIAYECLHYERKNRPTESMLVSKLKEALRFQEDIEIWKEKLPKDSKEIIKISKTPDTLSNLSNKELYEKLSEGILLKRGKSCLSVNNNGDRNEIVSATMFSFENKILHKPISLQNSRFKRVVKSMDITNLRIQIKIKTQLLSPNVIYGAHLVFKFCDPRKFSSKLIYVNLKYKMGSETLHAYFATHDKDEWMTIELCRFISRKKDINFKVLLESLSPYYCGSGAIYVEGILFQAIDDATFKVKPNSNSVQQLLVDYDEINEITQLEDDEKSFSPSIGNEKSCHMLPAKMVLYPESSNVKCFKWKSLAEPESRFLEVAELLSRQGFRIKCKIETQKLSPDTDYACYLVFKLSQKCHGLRCPVKVRDASFLKQIAKTLKISSQCKEHRDENKQKGEKSDRQGDPLSPFLFILVMEALEIVMSKACENGIYQGIKLPTSDTLISHLLFADDAIFLGDGTTSNMKNLMRILRCFKAASGLSVNYIKSNVYTVGIDDSQVNLLAQCSKCKIGSFPFTYLGLPVGANMNYIKNWKPVIDIFESRLSLWKAKTLSFGGKITLIKSVLGSLPIYYFSFFKAPNHVIESLERIRRRFLWGDSSNSNKISWIAWERMMAPKVMGGGGIGSLKASNISLLSKWWWRAKNDTGTKWLHEVLLKSSLTGIWKNIASIDKEWLKRSINMEEALREANGFFSTKEVRLLGENDESVMNESLMAYARENGPFGHIAPWQAMRKSTKWHPVPKLQTSTRTKTSSSGKYTTTQSDSTGRCFVNLNESDEEVEMDMPPPTSPQRPSGRNNKALPCNGVYETVMCIDNLGNGVFQIDSSNGVDKACLWHCRLGHINKKRMAQLQKDGVLESFDLRSDDTCESCLLGKMTKSPFTGFCERGEGLLDLIHTDVCGPFRSTTRDANRFYVTFTDDYSKYGYIYLIKHKSETFEKFKEFKQEVENQLGRKIKMFRSDRGGEYLSIEFHDYLKECGIVSQLTPPRTPQLNGVAERRNRTLLDMVVVLLEDVVLERALSVAAVKDGGPLSDIVKVVLNVVQSKWSIYWWKTIHIYLLT
ncbi:hypothetical protein E3N88_32928 [Mikania micrantha]|uniref:Integrase catalytic domain-containing protein n=1 Tax=Mikania micrantha TaxID=192012 RepID=A0A5N6MCH0_9ASTR|nr:hypothetical protein E3N88_32928 [Mikania micrantha]